MPSMIQIIKQAAIEAVEASNPTKVMYGSVVSTSPLSIKVDQRFTVTKEFLILTKNVKKYETVVFLDGEEKEVEIDNSLRAGDAVILLQQQGGQKYIVLDKVGG